MERLLALRFRGTRTLWYFPHCGCVVLGPGSAPYCMQRSCALLDQRAIGRHLARVWPLAVAATSMGQLQLRDSPSWGCAMYVPRTEPLWTHQPLATDLPAPSQALVVL